jgi:hypothetical protein
MPPSTSAAPARAGAGFPSSRLELVEDSYVLVPLDQPERMAQLISDHVAWQRSSGREPTAARDR